MDIAQIQSYKIDRIVAALRDDFGISFISPRMIKDIDKPNFLRIFSALLSNNLVRKCAFSDFTYFTGTLDQHNCMSLMKHFYANIGYDPNGLKYDHISVPSAKSVRRHLTIFVQALEFWSEKMEWIENIQSTIDKETDAQGKLFLANNELEENLAVEKSEFDLIRSNFIGFHKKSIFHELFKDFI